MAAHELKTVFGCILLTGYSKLPHCRMYWYSSGDVPSLLSESIRRNRFDEILKNLHLANNEALNPVDRIAKLRFKNSFIPYSLSNFQLHLQS